MFFPDNIARQLRVVLTAITLLLMVGLNNREIPTYAAVSQKATGQQVDNSATTDRHGTLKQKITFEATSSYLVLQIAAVLPEFLRTGFEKPVFRHVTAQYPANIVLNYFKTLLSTAIQVNAP